MTTLEAGDTLDHYRLDATVARSGMSTLFRATDLKNGMQVAIKVPHDEMEADPVLVERFKREQEIGQELDHPGVVKTDVYKRQRGACSWRKGVNPGVHIERLAGYSGKEI